jgi:hypothetical protein
LDKPNALKRKKTGSRFRLQRRDKLFSGKACQVFKRHLFKSLIYSYFNANIQVSQNLPLSVAEGVKTTTNVQARK